VAYIYYLTHIHLGDDALAAAPVGVGLAGAACKRWRRYCARRRSASWCA